ncbi:MAG: hypothetical protein KIT69_04885 [Propionibacteriaceae bacterium]|nr:hypothetical protein [Propionibacteriaceae bacterium]
MAAITVAVITHARIRRAQTAPRCVPTNRAITCSPAAGSGIGRGFQQQPWSRG